MKQMTRRIAAAAAACTMFGACAFADTISFEGTVANGSTYTVFAPIGGTVGEVAVSVGDRVAVGDVLVKLNTSKVYAEEDGTVTGVFAVPGDNTDTLTDTYGAALYVEGNVRYTISASTSSAYNAVDTKQVHVAEKVFFRSRSKNDRTGEGVITAVDGTSYTVRVASGEFINGESVDIFRDAAFTAAQKIGLGSVSCINPKAYNGTGSIVSVAVTDGQQVKRGDLLLETLTGTFDGLTMTGNIVNAPVDGVVSSVDTAEGSALDKDAAIAVIYPDSTMCVEGIIPETDLVQIAVGDQVDVELTWSEDDAHHYEGVVTSIGVIAGETADGAVGYTVKVSFTADETTRYGMSAVITTLDKEAE